MSTSSPLSIPFSSIDEGTRARNGKKYGEISVLAKSIQDLGTIHPIVLSRQPDGRYLLVAGGRRYKALQKLQVDTLWHGSTLDPAKPGFVFAEEVPQHIRLEAELDENLHRLDCDWIDNCLLVYEVHKAKKSLNGKAWGHRQTAALLGKGYNVCNVSYALRIAECLRKRGKDADKEIQSCSSMKDAISVLVKRKEDAALAELQARNAEKLKQRKAKSGPSSFLDEINIPLGGPAKPESAALDEVLSLLPETRKNGDLGGLLSALAGESGKGSKGPQEARSASAGHPAAQPPSPAARQHPIEVPLSEQFRLGDFRELLNEFDFYDHIVTDIPYGIDMDNLDEKMVADVKDEHDVEENLSIMPEFLLRAFNAVRSGGFCVFFYDLDHHEKLQKWALDVGWKVQRWPLIAAKTSPCRNNAAAYNTTKNFEVAMVLRKDEKTVLRSAQPSSYWVGDFAAERKLYNNPFAKPFLLWKWIYDMVAFPGQTVLDPFCGEMSACRAAVNCGLIPYGIEKKEQHFNRGLEHVKSAYALVHKSNCTFV